MNGERADALANLYTADIGQAQIGENQCGLAQDRIIETTFAIGRKDRIKPGPLEQNADGLAKILVVVNDQDGLHGHRDFIAGT
jgi:hypothetical protein